MDEGYGDSQGRMRRSKLDETSSDRGSIKSGAQGPTNEYCATLVGNIRRVLTSYFGGERKVLQVKIRRVEKDRVDGFLKVRSTEKHENFLFDFQATSTSRGEVSSLEVDGKKVAVQSNKSK